MAFMNQQKKKAIAEELKKVVPKDIKYSLAVQNHSTIVLTIKSAPIDLIEIYAQGIEQRGEDADWVRKSGTISLNTYWLNEAYGHFSERLVETFEKIKAAMNHGNWDNSDPMTDYFDVGHYIEIRIGSYKKPFEVK